MITSAQNKKIQEVRRLASKRKERETAGLYIAEGIRLVEEALSHAAECAYLLWCEEFRPVVHHAIYNRLLCCLILRVFKMFVFIFNFVDCLVCDNGIQCFVELL